MLGKHLETASDMLPADVLQGSVPRAENSKRRWQRLSTAATVVLKSGNSTTRNASSVKGRCRDTSRTGFAATFASPVAVGDIFYAELSIEEQPSFNVLARCVRCLMLAEDSFEAGFAFFQPIVLEETKDQRVKAATGDSSLL